MSASRGRNSSKVKTLVCLCEQSFSESNENCNQSFHEELQGLESLANTLEFLSDSSNESSVSSEADISTRDWREDSLFLPVGEERRNFQANQEWSVSNTEGDYVQLQFKPEQEVGSKIVPTSGVRRVDFLKHISKTLGNYTDVIRKKGVRNRSPNSVSPLLEQIAEKTRPSNTSNDSDWIEELQLENRLMDAMLSILTHERRNLLYGSERQDRRTENDFRPSPAKS